MNRIEPRLTLEDLIFVFSLVRKSLFALVIVVVAVLVVVLTVNNGVGLPRGFGRGSLPFWFAENRHGGGVLVLVSYCKLLFLLLNQSSEDQ